MVGLNRWLLSAGDISDGGDIKSSSTLTKKEHPTIFLLHHWFFANTEKIYDMFTGDILLDNVNLF